MHRAVGQARIALFLQIHGAQRAQDANRTKLDALSGAAFDKAYAENEAAYHKSVDDALSTTLIPDAQNAELKSLLQSGLKLFQDHLRDAPSFRLLLVGLSSGVILSFFASATA